MPTRAQIVGRQGDTRFAIRSADDKAVVVDLEQRRVIRSGLHWMTLGKGYWREPGEISPALREDILQLAGV